MSKAPRDQAARDRFRDEWDRNFAVSANAGSGKTTAISRRLAALALAPDAARLLRTTAVVTYTRKAAGEIGRRARQELLQRLQAEGRTDLAPLDHLEQAFFGTIHSFCLLLSRRYGQALGINLNPAEIADEDDEERWKEFLEADPMQFTRLAPEQVEAFLRHAPLERVFDLAHGLDEAKARRLLAGAPAGGPPAPAPAALAAIATARTKAGKSAGKLAANQALAAAWARRFQDEAGYLPIPVPDGKAAGIDGLFAVMFAPLKHWLAAAAGVLAAELALRYREWRFDRGIQNYADQIDAARALLAEPAILDQVRRDGWRVLLDEAQDTDAQQFEILVEITRPVGAAPGTWPGAGAGPRPGHFCMVGDGQQGIYGSRADIRKFQRHLAAFGDGMAGEHLRFDVTFRTPVRVADFLNRSLGPAFGPGREHNVGLPPAEGAPAPCLQVEYEALVPAPASPEGAIGIIPLVPAENAKLNVEPRFALEVRQVARFLAEHGPGAVGARNYGEICLLAPRNAWLAAARAELEAAGLKAALQARRQRNGDNPAYAWLTGLLAAVCDPTNTFEWVGVLREVFAVSDAAIAGALRGRSGFDLDDPARHPGAVGAALAVLRPFVLRVEAEGEPLVRFVTDLIAATALRAKAAAVDPAGALGDELDRLAALAATLGLDGGGPRALLRELLARIDQGRPAGKPEAGAVNLLTSHSAKGLEWPVVIPLGLWRPLRPPPEKGLRFVPGPDGTPRVYYDGASVPEETGLSRDRERIREYVRLLYVTLTRAKRALVLPWGEGFAKPEPESFLGLWGADLAALPVIAATPPQEAGKKAAEPPGHVAMKTDPALFPSFPARLLPHQLAEKSDQSRVARHESALDLPAPSRGGDEAIEYGLWWHELLEFTPWGGTDEAIEARAARLLAAAAAAGNRERGEAEWRRLRDGPAWRLLNDRRWERQAELGVFAPLGGDAWIDGVIDLILHDPVAGEVWIVDWKTNQRRLDEPDAALRERLVAEYRPQLQAYGRSAAGLFPGCRIRLSVYSTVAGSLSDIPPGAV
jgi:ATP-dependent helicase/nuclease subunit A